MIGFVVMAVFAVAVLVLAWDVAGTCWATPFAVSVFFAAVGHDRHVNRNLEGRK